jgi:uncharacterized protein (TIGR03118 family)
MKRRSLFRALLLLLAVGAILVQAAPVQAGTFRGSYRQTNLVSDIPGVAPLTDPRLVNPWGLSSSPTSPIWVADNNAASSTLYNGAGQKVPINVNIPAPGDAPGGPYSGAPTGTVFNPTGDFAVTEGSKSGKSFFLFDTEDGTVLGWNPMVDFGKAIIAVDNSTKVDRAGDVGAVYKGLANGSVGANNYLYAANFRFGTVDVFDGHFNQLTWAGAFTDTTIPAGFAPFGIQNIGGFVYVTYAMQNASKHDDVKGPGNGFVDVYTTSGALVKRLATRGTLNSPWGLALAPSTFGNFHDAILVGNFGDGLINGFRPDGVFRGQLKSETNAPIQNDGLWGLRFGNGGSGGDVNTLFFAAGIFDESHGLFGKIQNVD